MGSENFNRQFILLDFADLDNPDFLSFTRSPEFSTYLLMRRHIWRSREPHYMGLHDYYAKGYLACSLERERIAEQINLSLVSVSNDIAALQRRRVIESLRTGRQNIFVLGRWVEEEGSYFEHFYLDRLYTRSKESLISGDKPPQASEVKRSLSNNRERNKERNRERPIEVSMIREARNQERNVIVDYVEDLAREFNDEASLTASTSRMVKLYYRSGLDLERFIEVTLAARAATKERSSSIRKQVGNAGMSFSMKNRMTYFLLYWRICLGLLSARKVNNERDNCRSQC